MALAAQVFPNGIVRVAGSGTDLVRLSRIPYVRQTGKVFSTWWTYASDLRRDLGSSLLFRDGSGDALRQIVDRLNTAHKGDDAEVIAWFNPETPPKPFQLEAIHFGLSQERACFGHSTGLGKSICSLGVMLGAFARGQIRRAILCCPASLRTQWLREIGDKSNSKYLPANVRVASGDRAKRMAIYRGDWQILIISHDAARLDEKELLRWVPTVGLVILDEASAIRSADNKTTIALLRIFKNTRYRIALTATPIENGLHDLYSVMRWVDRRVFMSKKHFDERYVVWRRQQWTVKSKKGKTFNMKRVVPARYINLPEVRAKLRPVFVRKTADEVAVQLPSVMLTRETIELGDRQRKVYDQVRARTESDTELQALRQACDSTELVAEGRGERPASAKVERLKELLSGELLGESVIIFSEFERFVQILVRELKAFKPITFTGPMGETDRRVSIDRFVRGYSRVLIMTKAGERGLNLQVSGYMVLADLPWNPAAIKQRIGRLRRIGSKHSAIRIRLLVAADTVEETILLPKLETKQKLSIDVIGGDELSTAATDVETPATLS